MRCLISLKPGHDGLTSDQCSPFHDDRSASISSAIVRALYADMKWQEVTRILKRSRISAIVINKGSGSQPY